MTGTGRHVGMRAPPSRSGVGNVGGQPGGPTPDLEVEEAGGGGGCSAGTDPCVRVEQRGWG